MIVNVLSILAMPRGDLLISPCKVIVFRDSRGEQERMRKWIYAFALNNGEKQYINDGCSIEFSTSFKNNALVGYGRNDYGGLSRQPSLDSPFKFEADDGGVIKLISKPTWDYSGGNGKWKNNLTYIKGGQA
jgi:hypothetical protein